MTADTVSAELRQVLRDLKLSGVLDTVPERVALARQNHLPQEVITPPRPRCACSGRGQFGRDPRTEHQSTAPVDEPAGEGEHAAADLSGDRACSLRT
jgi:hypothetical protein